VAADSGAIGGDLSEEFQVIAATGEDAIVYCPNSDYAANMEKAQSLAPAQPRGAATAACTLTPTPGKSTCEDVAELLGVPLSTTVKSLVLATDETNDKGEILKSQVWLLLVRGDHDMNEVKVGKLPGFEAGFRFATLAEIEVIFNCRPGYLGPINLPEQGHLDKTIPESDVEIWLNRGGYKSYCPITRKMSKLPYVVNVIADRDVDVMSDWICGANQPGYHITGVNWVRDLPRPDMVFDIRNVVAGDASPDGKGQLAIERGIEVGHIFYLGTKYSAAMNATFLAEDGKPRLFEMGCYGIGITRLPAAAIEQNHDAKGIIWPDALAPFTVVICPIGPDRSPEVKTAAEALYAELLQAGVDVMLDDRGERPGAMFADWELIGVPHRVTIGDRGLKEGQVEYQHRRDAEPTKVALAEVAGLIKGKLAA